LTINEIRFKKSINTPSIDGIFHSLQFKMGLKLLLILLFFLLAYTHGEYTEHRVEILSEDKYSLEWWIDYEVKEVKFNVTVNTKGWVGFGISGSGGMKSADILTGGVFPNGTAYFSVN
jgi:hypothetical protein